MDPSDRESLELLAQARQRAMRLVQELRRQQAELLDSPAAIDPRQREAGMSAMNKAVEAAERMLASIEQAWQIASTSSN